jgi:hypothetical protein
VHLLEAYLQELLALVVARPPVVRRHAVPSAPTASIHRHRLGNVLAHILQSSSVSHRAWLRIRGFFFFEKTMTPALSCVPDEGLHVKGVMDCPCSGSQPLLATSRSGVRSTHHAGLEALAARGRRVVLHHRTAHAAQHVSLLQCRPGNPVKTAESLAYPSIVWCMRMVCAVWRQAVHHDALAEGATSKGF